MTAPIDSCDGDVGRVKKPTGFMTSSRHIAKELNRLCDASHDHVHLMAGKASAAQVYPPDLCKAMLRGIAKQKQEDKDGLVVTSRMTMQKAKNCVRSLSSVCIGTATDVVERALKDGKWPEHWRDLVHEEDSGGDTHGIRPQEGIEIMKEELDALIFRDGIAVARDDVSGKELVPKLVQEARDEEISYFMKRGVCEVVPRSHQSQTGGKLIGTRWVDVNRGDAEAPDCRSRLVGR